MNAEEFNKLSKLSDKTEAIKEMSPEEIEKLINAMQSDTFSNWNLCISETTNKIKNESKDIAPRVLENDFMLSQAKWAYKKYTFDSDATQAQIYQWDIFYCELGHNIGCEKNKRRPVLVLQNMQFRKKSKTTVIAPITTSERKQYSHEILLPTNQTANGRVHGVVDLSQIRVVSNSRLDYRNIDRILKIDEYKKDCEIKGVIYSEEDSVIFKIKRDLKRMFSIDN